MEDYSDYSVDQEETEPPPFPPSPSGRDSLFSATPVPSDNEEWTRNAKSEPPTPTPIIKKRPTARKKTGAGKTVRKAPQPAQPEVSKTGCHCRKLS